MKNLQNGPEKAAPTEETKYFERALLETRTIIISEEINPEIARKIYAKLLLLEKDSPEKPILVIINSQGGSADSGFGIYDMLRFVKSPVITLTAGLCASAAVANFLAGEKQKRFCLPNSRFLIHQPTTSAVGPASDLEITSNQILKIRDHFNIIIANETGQDVKKVANDTNRDYWLSAQEAFDYRLVSKIINTRDELNKEM